LVPIHGGRSMYPGIAEVRFPSAHAYSFTYPFAVDIYPPQFTQLSITLSRTPHRTEARRAEFLCNISMLNMAYVFEG